MSDSQSRFFLVVSISVLTGTLGPSWSWWSSKPCKDEIAAPMKGRGQGGHVSSDTRGPRDHTFELEGVLANAPP